jgi:hypothetical protein
VVGQFESADAAHNAGEQIRDILAQIAAWREQYYQQHGVHFGAHHVPPPPTPIEEQLAQRYAIELDWEQGVDWADRTDEAPQRVRVSDKLVVVSSLLTHYLEQPFSALIEQMGGESFFETAPEPALTQILVTITCNAPDVETMSTLSAVLMEYFSAIRESPFHRIVPPWSEECRNFATRGEVHVEGMTIQLSELSVALPDTLDLIMDFLSSKGCQNIEYRLLEHHLPADGGVEA